MRIGQNGPLDRFLIMHSSILCIVTYGTVKICDQRLTCIIHIISRINLLLYGIILISCTCTFFLMVISTRCSCVPHASDCRAGREPLGTSGTSTTPLLSTLLGLTWPNCGCTPTPNQGHTGSQCKLGTMLDHQKLFLKSRSMVRPRLGYQYKLLFFNG